ncbi:MAG: hypothetical protein MJ066_05725 [Clostridia bacterium]|nr:hypothetical protein [Clostridia bacterium]
MLYSFIVSQNNNIPRIKLILERLSKKFGDKKRFLDIDFYSFPKSEIMAKYDIKSFTELGLGYRDTYIERLSKSIANGFEIEKLNVLDTERLKTELLKIYGVGPKVADCVLLFGFHRSNSFPVDTWIEKVYKENLNGKLTDRKKISQFLADKYGENAGYFQQYMFYYKRSLENGKK